MVIPDVNVLVHAFRKDSPAHEVSRKWLEKQVSGPAAFGIADRVLEGFIRVVTHPGGFQNPDTVEAAVEFTEALSSASNCVRVKPAERQWDLFLELAAATGPAGNAVSDAWLAALAIESGSEWVTWDQGFARYPGLKWSTPTLSE